MGASGTIEVDPNPVLEGEDVSIHYEGTGPLAVSVDGGPWQELPLDKDGDGTLTAPVGSGVIVIADQSDPENEAIVQVESLQEESS